MLSVIIFLAIQCVLVNTDSVCGRCDCVYDSKTKNDYQGQIVDCSRAHGKILDGNYELPTLVHSLDLSSSNLSVLKNTSLFNSKTLSELLLNKNSIVEIKGDVFELPELMRLDLSDNIIEFLDKEVFKNMNKLEYLNLANNRLTSVEKLTFHHLSGLKEVVLDNNNLGPSLKDGNLFDRNGFGLTNKILTLSLRGIGLNNVPDNFFVDAYAIKQLTIANNNISDMFEIPYTLEYLDVSDNPITEVDSEDFAELPALKVLKLNNLRIKEVPDFLFSELKGLKVLELERNTNMTRFSRLAFGQEVLEDANDFALESLSLKNCRLKTLSKDLSEPFGQLVTLDLQGNPWTCDCNFVWIKKLQIDGPLSDNLRCGSPLPFYNQKVFEVKAKYFTCLIDRHYTGLKIAGISFGVSLTAIALWLAFVMPRYTSSGKIIGALGNPTTAYTILPLEATALHT